LVGTELMRVGTENKVRNDKKFNLFLFFIGAIFLLVILPSLAIYEAYSTPAPTQDLADFFEVAAFGSNTRKDRDHITKWEKGLKIYIGDEIDPRQKEDLDLVLTKLSLLSGLSLDIADKEVANFIVRYVKHADLESVAQAHQPSFLPPDHQIERTICISAYWTEEGVGRRRSAFDLAVAIISTDFPQSSYVRAFVEKLVRGAPYKWHNSCLREELMQMMGLPKDSDIVYPSVINDFVNNEIYSANDMIVIRTLYDPRIKAGMPKADVMKLVRGTIIPELISAYENGGEEALYQ